MDLKDKREKKGIHLSINPHMYSLSHNIHPYMHVSSIKR